MANIFLVLQTTSLPDCSPLPRWKLHTCMQQYLPNFKVISWAIDVLFRNPYLWLFLEVFDLDNFSSNFKAMVFFFKVFGPFWIYKNKFKCRLRHINLFSFFYMWISLSQVVLIVLSKIGLMLMCESICPLFY